MAKAKSKSKFDFKQFLLQKGEYLALGIAGFFLVILCLLGISKMSGAKNPDEIAKGMSAQASKVQSLVNSTEVTPQDMEDTKVPQWISTPYEFKEAPSSVFALTVPQFDPTANPDTKRENPNVLPIGAYQVDLIRGSMKGFDVVQGPEGEKIIAVIYDKKIDPNDASKLKELKNKFLNKKDKGKKGPMITQPPPPPTGGRPGGAGGFQPPPGGGSGDGPGEGRGNAYGGMMGGSFSFASQRVEKAIEYVPITQLDAAAKKNKFPAMTVIPVRMVTVHAEIPLKKQVDEIRRALRFQREDEARRWGPFYDGFNVKRRVTIRLPDGTVEEREAWTDYDFEEVYRARINSLRSADHFDEGYLSYFFRYEDALALPIPELITENGVSYPKLQLKNILETIKKLEAASKPQVTASELLKRVGGQSERRSIYAPQSAGQTGGDIWGAEGGMMIGTGGSEPPAGGLLQPPGGGLQPPGGQPPGPGSGPFGRPGTGGRFAPPTDKGNLNLSMPEIEHLLLRFVDPAVEPGMTYEYQIQLRLRNPNYKWTKEVSKPADAEKEFLESPWVQTAPITVPSETYLYAADWTEYAKRIKEDYDREKELQRRLEVKEHQAVVETLTWMEQVRTGENRREPVGAWVVASYPVGRGEYIGRKQYVKLPLWSSENKQYVLRELPDRVIPKSPGGKEPAQPRGWLMDFTGNKAILVDYEGGKVRTRVGNRETADEVATEMLVLRGDDKLVVKRSADLDSDTDRKKIVTDWEKWIKEVAARKASQMDGSSGFDPRPPGMP